MRRAAARPRIVGRLGVLARPNGFLTEAGEGTVLAVYPSGSGHNYISSRVSAPSAGPRHTLEGYTLLWGDVHRNTDISEDGGIIDGSLLETMRYSLDVAGLVRSAARL